MSDSKDTEGSVLVDLEWLEKHLGDPGLRVVEVDVGPAGYEEGHIQGAVLWNVYADLKDDNYQLATKESMEHLVGRSGIDHDSTVVFYGYAPAMGFWLMRLYEHPDVRILNSSRSTWRDAGRPWASEVVSPVTTRYALRGPDSSVRAEYGDVERGIADPKSTILDVRSDLEYHGERFWPSGMQEAGGRAGHVPSAINLPIDEILDSRGSFRDEDDLRRLFSSIDLEADGEVISYCTIGGRASTAWFALTYLLGRKRVRVYDGSWAEWGRMQESPVAVA
jgi:thiosulfate/3-mercaptopyruvate sulfurtransferase